LGRLLRRQHELGGSEQGILALRHGDDAGVTALAQELDLDPALPHCARDDSDGQGEPLEYRSLLYMNLEIAEQVGPVACGFDQGVRVPAEGIVPLVQTL
jgi:hypothetical protein